MRYQFDIIGYGNAQKDSSLHRPLRLSQGFQAQARVEGGEEVGNITNP